MEEAGQKTDKSEEEEEAERRTEKSRPEYTPSRRIITCEEEKPYNNTGAISFPHQIRKENAAQQRQLAQNA